MTDVSMTIRAWQFLPDPSKRQMLVKGGFNVDDAAHGVRVVIDETNVSTLKHHKGLLPAFKQAALDKLERLHTSHAISEQQYAEGLLRIENARLKINASKFRMALNNAGI